MNKHQELLYIFLTEINIVCFHLGNINYHKNLIYVMTSNEQGRIKLACTSAQSVHTWLFTFINKALDKREYLMIIRDNIC